MSFQSRTKFPWSSWISVRDPIPDCTESPSTTGMLTVAVTQSPELPRIVATSPLTTLILATPRAGPVRVLWAEARAGATSVAATMAKRAIRVRTGLYLLPESLCGGLDGVSRKQVSFFRKELSSRVRDGHGGGEAAGARTRDPRLKRPLLYQLSYRPPTADRCGTDPAGPTVNFRVAVSGPDPVQRPSSSVRYPWIRRSQACGLEYAGSVAETLADMTLRNEDGFPVPSMESLRRPLTAGERREIWGDRSGSLSLEDLEELDRIRQSGDEESRALAEACLHALIFQALSDRMLDPDSGYGPRFERGISDAVDSFNRVIR